MRRVPCASHTVACAGESIGGGVLFYPRAKGAFSGVVRACAKDVRAPHPEGRGADSAVSRRASPCFVQARAATPNDEWDWLAYVASSVMIGASPQSAGTALGATATALADQLDPWRWGEGCWDDRDRGEGSTTPGRGIRVERARHADILAPGGGQSPSRRSTAAGRRRAFRQVQGGANSTAEARHLRSGCLRGHLPARGRRQRHVPASACTVR